MDYAYNSCSDTERGNYYEGVLETLIEDLHRLEQQGKQISANSCKTCTDEQKPIEREEHISIPFGAYDSELVSEIITIPNGCYATIEDNKIHIKRKGKSALEAIKEEKVDNANKVKPSFNQ